MKSLVVHIVRKLICLVRTLEKLNTLLEHSREEPGLLDGQGVAVHESSVADPDPEPEGSETRTGRIRNFWPDPIRNRNKRFRSAFESGSETGFESGSEINL
jgi:hypothetical protein